MSSLASIGNKQIENLDSVDWNFDHENKTLGPNFKPEGEKRTARHFALGKPNQGHYVAARDKAEFKSIRRDTLRAIYNPA